MGSLQPWHWAIIAIVFLALFGYKKLPDATRSVGRSLRIFKSEMKGLHDDLREDDDDEVATERPRATPPSVIEAQPLTEKPAAAKPTSTTAGTATTTSTARTSEASGTRTEAATPPANGS